MSHNEVREKKDASAGRVLVFARTRPFLAREEGDLPAVRMDNETDQVVVSSSPDVMSCLNESKEVQMERKEKSFKLDGAFPDDATQKEVFQKVGLPVLVEVMKGFNGCIFAYGQTGSGKTHSLLNTEVSDLEQVGILPRLIATLYARAAMDKQNVYTIRCAGFQVYNEQVDDLLHPEHKKGKGQNLAIQTGGDMPDLTWTECKAPNELLEVFRRARGCIHYAETKMNKASSRSHAVFQIRVIKRKRSTGTSLPTGEGKPTTMQATCGQLSVVDLAGSERIKKSGVTGNNFKEATNINGSLLALGNVIQALADKRKHVPFRDSKLTRILERSVGGNCKTSLLVCVSPAETSTSETLSTLEFASRAMCVEVNACINETVVEIDAALLAADMEGSNGATFVDENMLKTYKESEQALADAKLKAQEQAQAAEQLRAKMGEIEKSLTEKERSLSDALREGQSKTSTIEQLRQTLTETQKKHQLELEQSRQATARIEASLSQSQRELEQNRFTLTSLQAKVSQESERRAEAEKRLAALQEDLRVSQQQSRQAIDKLEASNKQVTANLEAEIAARESERRELTAAVQTEKLRVEALDSSIRKLESKRTHLCQELEEGTSKTASLQKDLLEASERLARLEKVQLEAQELRRDLDCARTTERELSDKITENTTAKQGLEKQLAGLSQRCSTLQSGLEEETRKRISLEGECVMLKVNLQHVEQNLAATQAHMEETERARTREMTMAKQAWADERASIQKEHETTLSSARLVEKENAERKERHHAEAIKALEERAGADMAKAAERLRSVQAEASKREKKLCDKHQEDLARETQASQRTLEIQRKEAERERRELEQRIQDGLDEMAEMEQASLLRERVLREEYRLKLLYSRASQQAARRAVEKQTENLAERYRQLHGRFVSRESRKEDLALIAAQQKDIREMTKHVKEAKRLAKQKQVELDHVTDNVRIFGAKGAETSRPGSSGGLPGQKIGDTRDFLERKLRTPTRRDQQSRAFISIPHVESEDDDERPVNYRPTSAKQSRRTSKEEVLPPPQVRRADTPGTAPSRRPLPVPPTK